MGVTISANLPSNGYVLPIGVQTGRVPPSLWQAPGSTRMPARTQPRSLTRAAGPPLAKTCDSAVGTMQVATEQRTLPADPGGIVDVLIDVVNTSDLIDGVVASLIGLDATAVE